jgi:hypothetical protein
LWEPEGLDRGQFAGTATNGRVGPIGALSQGDPLAKPRRA